MDISKSATNGFNKQLRLGTPELEGKGEKTLRSVDGIGYVCQVKKLSREEHELPMVLHIFGKLKLSFS